MPRTEKCLLSLSATEWAAEKEKLSPIEVEKLVGGRNWWCLIYRKLFRVFSIFYALVRGASHEQPMSVRPSPQSGGSAVAALGDLLSWAAEANPTG